jgi:adenylate cyclase
VLSLLAALAVQFLPLTLAAPSSAALLIVALVAPVARASSGTLLHSIYPALAVAFAIPLSGAVRYLAETRLRRRVSSLFARYVPPAVAEELVRDGRLAEVAEGQRLEVTVFFCDLRGFTPLAATLEPSQVNAVLSRYYEYVSAAVLSEGGTIIQYVGDEVFAVFGAPLARADHAAAALRCALDVQARRIELEQQLTEHGLPMVDFGIGINAGEVVAVHAGSTFRRQYAVVGDPVNVGSRLCSEARTGQVVASDSAVDEKPGSADHPVGEQYHPDLKGVDRDVVAWRFTPEPVA